MIELVLSTKTSIMFLSGTSNNVENKYIGNKKMMKDGESISISEQKRLGCIGCDNFKTVKDSQ